MKTAKTIKKVATKKNKKGTQARVYLYVIYMFVCMYMVVTGGCKSLSRQLKKHSANILFNTHTNDEVAILLYSSHTGN